MYRSLPFFFAWSFGIHATFFLISRFSTPPFQLALQKGEPIEISKQSVGDGIVSKPKDVPAAPGLKTPPAAQTTERRGITDGSEFGISKPRYPDSSRLRGEEGKVLLKLSFDSTKSLVGAAIIDSSGHPELDRAALLQVERDLPRSKTTDVAFEHLIQFNFHLNDIK